jgi:hypothetical protein
MAAPHYERVVVSSSHSADGMTYYTRHGRINFHRYVCADASSEYSDH